MIEAIKQGRMAAQVLYGFTGGDSKELGRAVWKLGALLQTIDNWEEEIDAENTNSVSA
jgi:hypothetical protein